MAPVRAAPTSGAGPAWGHPVPAPAKRNTPMLVLVFTLGVLILVGLCATVWLLNERNNNSTAATSPTQSATVANPGPAPIGSEDARFYAKKGDCVVNEGTDGEPNMRTTACTSGTYLVLERFTGKTTGEKDAEGKCAKVTGYTKWYFYDSPLDDFDFVLCLKEHSDS
jgi:hypothetical protein